MNINKLSLTDLVALKNVLEDKLSEINGPPVELYDVNPTAFEMAFNTIHKQKRELTIKIVAVENEIEILISQYSFNNSEMDYEH